MNKVILTGRIGRLELKTSRGGNAIMNFSVATDDLTKVDGKWDTKTSWHRCVTFGKTAERMDKHLFPGSIVSIEGRLDYSSVTRDDGVKHYYTNIIADRVEFVANWGEKNRARRDGSNHNERDEHHDERHDNSHADDEMDVIF